MIITPTIEFLRLRLDEDSDIPLPKYMTASSAGMDIYAAPKQDIMITSGEISLIPTGFAMALPKGFEAQIRPRSGLAVKHGIGIINSPGTIDADYRGEVKIAIINLGTESFKIRRGHRIAQMIIHQVFQANLKIVEKLDETVRNNGGFGHTGI